MGFMLVGTVADALRRRWVALPGALLVALGCSPAQSDASPPIGSDEQQSRAEYDIARDLWLNRHEPRGALQHALRAVELDSDHAEASHLVALLYLDFCRSNANDCRPAEAERFARDAVEAGPDFHEAKNTLGVVLIHRRKYPEAITILKQLADNILYRTPENAWGNLGWAYLEQGRVDDAIQALKRSVAAQPAFCVGHFRLGQAYEKKQALSSALEAYSNSLDAAETRCQGLQEAYAGRARVLIQMDRRDGARKDLLKCVQLDKSSGTGRQCTKALGELK